MRDILKLEDRINEFWNQFQDSYQYLINELDELNDEVRFDLSEKLREVQENLCFEVVHGLRQIIISADGIEEVFEVVEAVYEKRPKITGWEVVKYRQPVPAEDIEGQEISLGDYKISFSDILYDLVVDEDAGIILIMLIPGYDPEDQMHEILRWIILDHIIGEYDAVKKIGYFDTYPTSEIENLDPGLSAQFRSPKYLQEELNQLWEEYTESAL